MSAAAYGTSGLLHTRGEWTAPLDDPYIYYRYAQSFAAGHPFSYQPGDPPTTGATSLLHLLLLVPWFLAGVRGSGAVVVTFAGAALCLAATLWLLRDLLERRAGREAALWGTFLYAASGPIAWGTFSGMEIPLVDLFLVASCRAILIPSSGRARALALAGLALSRPEGHLFALALLALALGARAWRAWAGRARAAGDESPGDARGGDARGEPVRSDTPPPPTPAALLLPAALGFLPFLLSLALTGTPSLQSLRAKALLFEGSTTAGELAARGADYFAFVVKGLFAGAEADPSGALSANRGQVGTFFPPLAFALFVLGVLPGAAEEARRARPAFFLPAAAWFFGGLLLESALLPYSSHWNRYEMPFFPLFLIGVVLGAERLRAWVGPERGGPALARGILGLFLAYSAVGWAQLAVGFGRNARDIHDQHVAAARWIDASLPPDARVAVNDAGALAYFGRRPILDLLGLVSRGPTDPVNEGAGALYEHLESLPAARRPTHFAIYPDWMRLSDSGLLGTPVHTAPLFRPSIAGSPQPLTIYPASWALAGSGERPLGLPPGWRVVDALDVADLASERRHAYRFRRPGPGLPESDALALAYAGEGAPRVADGGRLLAGGERFRAAVRPGVETFLVARTDGPFVLDVRVGGRRAGTWTYNGPQGVFSEGGFPIARELVVSPEAEISLEVPPALGQRGYRIFHYWVCQRD